MVVLGILVVLAGIAFPVVRSVQRSARQTQCASNMRQLAQALIMYANGNKGAYPPNSGADQIFWYQGELLGPYVSSKIRLSDGSIARGVFVCPDDLPDSVRSYSMNVFASSYFSPTIKKLMEKDPPTKGRPFRAGAPDSTHLILLLESWCEMPQPVGSPKPEGYAAQAHVGFAGGTPGQRFGAGIGIAWTDPPDAAKGRFDVRATQIDFHRHAPHARKHVEDPRGAANFAFADGHVERLLQEECANLKTGRSTFRAMWSPIDRQLEDQAVAIKTP
jgi:prepilin-type processing-associated H-X9-DG protein